MRSGSGLGWQRPENGHPRISRAAVEEAVEQPPLRHKPRARRTTGTTGFVRCKHLQQPFPWPDSPPSISTYEVV